MPGPKQAARLSPPQGRVDLYRLRWCDSSQHIRGCSPALASHLDLEMEVSGFAMDDTAYRVLIIDDELSLLKSLVAFFEDEGFFVRGAESGEEGLEILKTEKMDVVIIDLRLPGIDGNETIVRAHELQPALRFLIHTGSTDYQIPPPFVV